MEIMELQHFFWDKCRPLVAWSSLYISKCKYKHFIFFLLMHKYLKQPTVQSELTFLTGLSIILQSLLLIFCSSSNLEVTSSMESCSRSQNPARSWEVGRGMALGSCTNHKFKHLRFFSTDTQNSTWIKLFMCVFYINPVALLVVSWTSPGVLCGYEQHDADITLKISALCTQNNWLYCCSNQWKVNTDILYSNEAKSRSTGPVRLPTSDLRKYFRSCVGFRAQCWSHDYYY